MTDSPDCEVNNKSAVLAIRLVIFVYYDNEIKTLLVKTDKSVKWNFPIGYVKREETIHTATQRVIFENTEIQDFFFHQIGFFETSADCKQLGAITNCFKEDHLLFIDHYVILRWDVGMRNHINTDYRWFAIDKQPLLTFVDEQLLKRAQSELVRGLSYQPIGYYLVAKRFTISELQDVYEQILRTKLNRGNFYRKMLAYSILNKLNEVRTGGAHKAPDLYEFDEDKYFNALQTGLVKAF